MHQIIVTEFITLDGVIEAPGGGDYAHAGWTFKDIEFVPEAYEIKGREQEEAAGLLLGRVSFEEFAPVWPSMDEEFPLYNRMPKYVVSTSLTEAEVTECGWENCRLLRSIEDVRALKEQGEGPIYVHGSASLAQSLAEAGIVDRYHLLTFPLVLGEGKRLFAEDGDRKQRLSLVEEKAFSNGIRLAVYDVVA
ncbi:dihydrofolate reductase family protein [Falsarthrobacter nasiphocae]|uniref:Dihydrofolate reductase n=1 Tax=Falsarthrobacter nasiphocae TaxID=189863 RepID=A0AAE3YE13_9MICC|nr:dihydrofolate reductase family protein [Falsarthrobacter nasiphocae]MDR6892128.1 dihydrofolate reductase [Falsarthrobacter nasiphocae]